MRCRTGRFVGYKNIEGAAYEVDLDIPWFFSPTGRMHSVHPRKLSARKLVKGSVGV